MSDFGGFLKDQADRSMIVNMLRGMNPMDQGAVATSMVPGVGDVVGTSADISDMVRNWGERDAYGNAAAIGATALGVLPFVPSRSQAKAAKKLVADKIRAYHGSPHDFDEFKMSQIGTGEGAQAYGHGLYFAESEDVAKQYRDADLKFKGLQGEPLEVTIDGKPLVNGNGVELGAADALLDPLVGDVGDVQGTAKVLREYEMEDVAEFLEKNADRLDVKRKGHMYQVEIDASPDELLDWDLPLSEQSELVQDFMRGVESPPLEWRAKQVTEADNFPGAKVGDWVAATDDGYWGGSAFGSEAAAMKSVDARNNLTPSQDPKGYSLLQNNMRGMEPGQKSQAMQNAGIKGIRYKDGFSRGAEGGTSNFVIFDEDIITIAKKYGVAVPVAAAMLYGDKGGEMYEEA